MLKKYLAEIERCKTLGDPCIVKDRANAYAALWYKNLPDPAWLEMKIRMEIHDEENS
jgi:hypothetical protein